MNVLSVDSHVHICIIGLHIILVFFRLSKKNKPKAWKFKKNENYIVFFFNLRNKKKKCRLELLHTYVIALCEPEPIWTCRHAEHDGWRLYLDALSRGRDPMTTRSSSRPFAAFLSFIRKYQRLKRKRELLCDCIYVYSIYIILCSSIVGKVLLFHV